VYPLKVVLKGRNEPVLTLEWQVQKPIERASTLVQRTCPKLGPRTLSHCFFAAPFWRESAFYIQKPWNPKKFLIQKKFKKPEAGSLILRKKGTPSFFYFLKLKKPDPEVINKIKEPLALMPFLM
jgi:hypothetical protein